MKLFHQLLLPAQQVLNVDEIFQEGLLERQEVLQWILDLLERLKLSNIEDGLLRLFLSLTLQYLHEFVQSEQLSRRLVNLCARKLSHLVNVAINQQQQQQQLQIENNSNHPATPQTPSPCPAPNQSSNQQNNNNTTKYAFEETINILFCRK